MSGIKLILKVFVSRVVRLPKKLLTFYNLSS